MNFDKLADLESIRYFLKRLSNEQKKDLARMINEIRAEEKKTGYEIPERDKLYWYIDAEGNIETEFWDNDIIDWKYYKNVNVYTNEKLAKSDARADKLIKSLRRFAKLNNKKEIDWDDKNQKKWYIYYNFQSNCISQTCSYAFRATGIIYFDNEDTVKEAINKYEKELLWYFKEYL